MDATESVLRAGHRLDRYELLLPIASGGMATVWLARLEGKRGFEKLFAIKTIKTELVEDARFTEMFLDEARIASGIQHPNVAQILDLGEHDDVLYIVMEWVDGESLAKVRRLALKRGNPIPLAIALRVMADSCAGLHAAHELKDVKGQSLGVVHRDVSPHNILLSASGGIKVIDFGVAKAKNRGAGETRSGIVKGKVRYMAPEQVQGQPVDRRADLWAVGVCLHELVTGQLPFDGESDVDIIRRLMGDEPPPAPGDAVPPEVRAILSRSLVRKREDRFATAAAMQRALENALDKLGLAATSDDVEAFLKESMPELETKRRETVTRAIDESRARAAESGTSRAARSSVTNEDVAFAPTVMSEREPLKKTVALAKKKPAPKLVTQEDDEEEKRDESKVTPGAMADDEDLRPAGLPRRGRFVFAVLMLGALGAGAWFGWPGKVKLRALYSNVFASAPADTGTTATPEPPPSAIVSIPPPPPSPPTTTVATTPSAAVSGAMLGANVAVSAGTAGTAASAHPSASASAKLPRFPWQPGMKPSAKPSAEPSDSATSMPPPPASTGTSSDDMNPY